MRPSTHDHIRRITNCQFHGNIASLARQKFQNTRGIFLTGSANLYAVFSRRQQQEYRRLADKKAIDPRLGTGGFGTQQQFSRVSSGLPFQIRRFNAAVVEREPVVRCVEPLGWSPATISGNDGDVILDGLAPATDAAVSAAAWARAWEIKGAPKHIMNR